MNPAGLYIISRKRRWELAQESQDATTLRDGLYGAMVLMIAAILLAVYLTS